MAALQFVLPPVLHPKTGATKSLQLRRHLPFPRRNAPSTAERVGQVLTTDAVVTDLPTTPPPTPAGGGMGGGMGGMGQGRPVELSGG